MKRIASEYLAHFFVLAIFLVPESDSFPLGRASFSERHRRRRRGGIETLRGARMMMMKRNYMVSPISPQSDVHCGVMCDSLSPLRCIPSHVTYSYTHPIDSRDGVEFVGHVKFKTVRKAVRNIRRTIELTSTTKLNVCHSELKARPFLFHLILRSIPRSGHT